MSVQKDLGLPAHCIGLGSLGPDCPTCQSPNSHVLDRRDGTRRRRACGVCGTRFTTYEVVGTVVPYKLAQRLHKARDLITEVLGSPEPSAANILAARPSQSDEGEKT